MRIFIVLIGLLVCSPYIKGQQIADSLIGNWRGVMNQLGENFPALMEVTSKGGNEFDLVITSNGADKFKFIYQGIYKMENTKVSDNKIPVLKIDAKNDLVGSLLGRKCKQTGDLVFIVTENGYKLFGSTIKTSKCLYPYTLTFNKILSPNELEGVSLIKKKRDEEKRMLDSINLNNQDAKKYKYHSCNDADVKNLDLSFYPEIDCTSKNFFSESGGKIEPTLNLVFYNSPKDRSKSYVSMQLENKNIFDTHIFGTWISKEHQIVYRISLSNFRKPGIFISTYKYSNTLKKYQSFHQEGRIEPSALDSTMYLELVNIDDDTWIPVAYRLKSYNQIVFNPVSLNYRLPRSSFQSKFDYRNYFKANQNNKDFFFNPISLVRLTYEELNEMKNVDDDLKSALIKLTIAPEQGFTVSPTTNFFKEMQGYISNQKSIVGFDQFWNPVFNDDQKNMKNIYFTISGIKAR